jgi:hypothetical protein
MGKKKTAHMDNTTHVGLRAGTLRDGIFLGVYGVSPKQH